MRIRRREIKFVDFSGASSLRVAEKCSRELSLHTFFCGKRKYVAEGNDKINAAINPTLFYLIPIKNTLTIGQYFFILIVLFTKTSFNLCSIEPRTLHEKTFTTVFYMLYFTYYQGTKLCICAAYRFASKYYRLEHDR